MTAVQICNFKIYFMLSHTFAIHSIKYMTNMWKQICLPPGWLMLLVGDSLMDQQKAPCGSKRRPYASIFFFKFLQGACSGIGFHYPLGWKARITYPCTIASPGPRKEDVSYLKNLGIGFPGGSAMKNSPADAGDKGSIPGPGGSHMPRSN